MGEILIAPEGMVWTNGKIYGREIHLADNENSTFWVELSEYDAKMYCEPKAKTITTFDSTSLNVVENEEDGTWGTDFVIYAKTSEPKAKTIQAGVLYSDYYCYEDELLLDNTDVLKFTANEIGENGGYAIALRGLTAYDECYFRPFAIYEIEGEEVIAYGNILMNELFYQHIVNQPMTLELTEDDYASMPEAPSAFSLYEWMKANGYENAGITTYLVED